MKRQRGRNRGGGNTGGGQKPTHNVNRAFDSNGPDGVKIRGAAQHVFEKYQQLARDASASGDRVLGENYLQHAEHYFRLIRAVQPMKPASEIIGRDTFSGYDIDFEDETGQHQQELADSHDAETGGEVQAEAPREQQQQQQPRGEYRDNRDNNGQRQEWRRDRDNNGQRRDERPRDDRPRDERPRDDRPRDDRPREDRPRDDRPRDERPPREDRPNRNRDRDRDRDRPERIEPAPAPESEAVPVAAAPAPAPAPADDFQLRSHDGGLSPAPAFLQARAEPRPEAAEAEAGEAKRPRAPRRRRAPRGFEGGEEGSAPAAETEDA